MFILSTRLLMLFECVTYITARILFSLSSHYTTPTAVLSIAVCGIETSIGCMRGCDIGVGGEERIVTILYEQMLRFIILQ